MFEEELEKYINAAFCREKTGIEEITIEDLKQSFQDGYNKANEYAKTIVKDLLNNSDEYARHRAMDFLEEKK